MKSINTIAVVLLCLISGVVSSQTIHVRVGGQTNLRDDNSLDGAIVETIPAGTMILVTNWEDHWLRVMHGGERAWMADWVGYSLLLSDDDADATAPLSQTENCCVLEWQCPDQKARTSGYWAYRFGQCHYSDTYLNRAFTVNNCCFIGDKLCLLDKHWREGHASFHNAQCVPFGVHIDASDDLKLLMFRALAMLKDRAPVWYAYVISGLDSVTEVAEALGAGVDVRSRKFYENASALQVDGPGEAPTIWMASVLAHEACHVHLYEAKVFPTTRTSAAEEKLCTEVQLMVVDNIDPTDYFNAYFQTVIDNIHNPEYQWW